ncbi:protein rigor mortis [Toxorhynchites rutilus septentrionalis]|uniref:protein rigor mortis n=1 Tax=Toxorhynchites rutilus septentrionalis TaxID=329112 RepID=UPI002478CFCA|nr:protein rigor mortis [Toxorhynchites rutilus septentrionalis]
MDIDMNGFVVPNMQSWFRQNSIISTPGNGLLYHSRTDVNYIAPLQQGQMPRVRIINCRAGIKSLACSPDWTERREFATFDDQNHLQVWNLDQGVAVKGHKGHVFKLSRTEYRFGQNEVTSAICFTQTEKIISVDHSVMIIYCMVTDTYKLYADFFRPNCIIVVLSACPQNRYVFAAGMKNGLIQLFSIKDMTVLCSLRGHDKEVVSIDWMQVKVQEERGQTSWRSEERPKIEARTKATDKREEEKPAAAAAAAAAPAAAAPAAAAAAPAAAAAAAINAAAASEDIFDIYDYNENDEEFGTIVDRETSSMDRKDTFRDKVHTTEGFNFLEACQNLKQDIIKANQEPDAEDLPDDVEQPQDCNTDEENELDEAEKLRDFIIVDKDESQVDPPEEAQEDEGRLMTVLLSGSRENVLYFWDYESGVVIDKLYLPNSHTSKRLCPGIFTTAVWLNPRKVIANNVSGHVFEWSVSFVLRGTRIRLVAKQNPIRYPVDMIIYLIRANGAFGKLTDANADYVWCTSINRKLVGVAVTEKPQVVADLTCLPTGNMCIVENPMESTVIAVACPDRRLVTINLASVNFDEIICVPFMNKIPSKVTALDWHPVRENYIAFGTSEGRIGLYDTNNPNNVPVLLASFLSTDVYTLKWCELTDEFHQKSVVLFATGKSKLAYYKMIGAGKHDPIELRQFGMVSSVSASGNFLFVGTQDGFLFINDLSKNMAQLYHGSITRRYICSMQFKDNILAVSSNEIHIRLIDFSDGMDDKVNDNIKLLEGHTEGVCTVRWGHGDSKLLVSGSFDNTVRVWDTQTCSCIASYRSVDSVFSALFSPIHENIIILSGKGTTLEFVDYTKYPAESDIQAKKTKPSIKWATQEDRIDKKAARDRKRAGKSMEKSKKSVSFEQISDDRSETSLPESLSAERMAPPKADDTETCRKSVDLLSDHLREIKIKEFKPVQLKTNIPTTFHLTNREINKSVDILACITKLAHFKEPDEDQEDTNPKEHKYFNEKLFTTEKDLKELIDEEIKNHHDFHTASIGTILLPQIGFRLKEEIIARIASKTLTDQLVALAPSISYQFWQKCCEAYAYQFLEKQYTLASIPYFLASHKIAEAIDYLCKNKYFREAWVICRMRKASDDPVLEQVANEWAQYLESVGNMEGAALIWTASKKYKNAVAVLSKRKELTEDIQRAIDVLNGKLQETEE